jgi:hypothetical protein
VPKPRRMINPKLLELDTAKEIPARPSIRAHRQRPQDVQNVLKTGSAHSSFNNATVIHFFLRIMAQIEGAVFFTVPRYSLTALM